MSVLMCLLRVKSASIRERIVCVCVCVCVCVYVSENTGSKMKAALIHILLHMHRHSSFSSRVHTVSFSNTDTHTHARQGGLRRQLGDAGEGVSPEFHCSSQRGIYVENLLDKKGVGNGG